MSFEDASQLVRHCEAMWPTISQLHDESIAQQRVQPTLLIDVKNFLENLRSALDYGAYELFRKYGQSRKANPKIYFPYAKQRIGVPDFKSKVVEQCIPGLLAARPDIVDKLAGYQYFGPSGNWLPVLMQITNEHKHEQLTPQVQKTYQVVTIEATIPPGQTVHIDLKKIPLRPTSDKPYRGTLSTWTGLIFAGTGVQVIPFLEQALQNVKRIIDDLSIL